MNPITVYAIALLIAILFNTFAIKTTRDYDVFYTSPDGEVGSLTLTEDNGNKLGQSSITRYLEEYKGKEIVVTSYNEIGVNYKFRWE